METPCQQSMYVAFLIKSVFNMALNWLLFFEILSEHDLQSSILYCPGLQRRRKDVHRHPR